MKKVALTSAHRADLRARAHGLAPVVMIGADGLTPAVLNEIDSNLKAHELIKVRVLGDDREERVGYYDKICTTLGALPIQHIGKLLVMWRAAPQDAAAPKSERRGAGPRTVVVVKPSRSGRRPATRKAVTVLGNQRVTAGGKVKRAKPRQKSLKRG